MESERNSRKRKFAECSDRLKIINLDNARNVFENCEKIRKVIRVGGILFVAVSKNILTPETSSILANEINKATSTSTTTEVFSKSQEDAIDLEGFSLVEAIQCLTFLTEDDPQPMVLDNLCVMSYEDKFQLLEALLDDGRIVIKANSFEGQSGDSQPGPSHA
ncbi:uncharacterized protein LOC123686427 [Harmonia axyridis]|uniref:uncharacterized protein LOC123686427 n=1 Tax=Harmonia axyridis TaxID=115357 RepID=UPI001E275EDC|nr:uncharacterized protein LOC123686427 [Harmonia axyridis]